MIALAPFIGGAIRNWKLALCALGVGLILIQTARLQYAHTQTAELRSQIVHHLQVQAQHQKSIQALERERDRAVARAHTLAKNIEEIRRVEDGPVAPVVRRGLDLMYADDQ